MYAKIELTRAVIDELRSSLPQFTFKSQKKFKVLATCNHCWEVDPDKIKHLISSRERLGFNDHEKIQQIRSRLKDEYRRVQGRAYDLHPRDQRKELHRARVMFEAADKNARLLGGDIDFKQCVRQVSSRHYLLQVVDWAMAHKCTDTASKNNAVTMAEMLFEIGVAPGGKDLEKSRSKKTDRQDTGDEDDLLDLIPD